MFQFQFIPYRFQFFQQLPSFSHVLNAFLPIIIMRSRRARSRIRASQAMRLSVCSPPPRWYKRVNTEFKCEELTGGVQKGLFDAEDGTLLLGVCDYDDGRPRACLEWSSGQQHHESLERVPRRKELALTYARAAELSYPFTVGNRVHLVGLSCHGTVTKVHYNEKKRTVCWSWSRGSTTVVSCSQLELSRKRSLACEEAANKRQRVLVALKEANMRNLPKIWRVMLGDAEGGDFRSTLRVPRYMLSVLRLVCKGVDKEYRAMLAEFEALKQTVTVLRGQRNTAYGAGKLRELARKHCHDVSSMFGTRYTQCRRGPPVPSSWINVDKILRALDDKSRLASGKAIALRSAVTEVPLWSWALNNDIGGMLKNCTNPRDQYGMPRLAPFDVSPLGLQDPTINPNTFLRLLEFKRDAAQTLRCGAASCELLFRSGAQGKLVPYLTQAQWVEIIECLRVHALEVHGGVPFYCQKGARRALANGGPWNTACRAEVYELGEKTPWGHMSGGPTRVEPGIVSVGHVEQALLCVRQERQRYHVEVTTMAALAQHPEGKMVMSFVRTLPPRLLLSDISMYQAVGNIALFEHMLRCGQRMSAPMTLREAAVRACVTGCTYVLERLLDWENLPHLHQRECMGGLLTDLGDLPHLHGSVGRQQCRVLEDMCTYGGYRAFGPVVQTLVSKWPTHGGMSFGRSLGLGHRKKIGAAMVYGARSFGADMGARWLALHAIFGNVLGWLQLDREVLRGALHACVKEDNDEVFGAIFAAHGAVAQGELTVRPWLDDLYLRLQRYEAVNCMEAASLTIPNHRQILKEGVSSVRVTRHFSVFNPRVVLSLHGPFDFLRKDNLKGPNPRWLDHILTHVPFPEDVKLEWLRKAVQADDWELCKVIGRHMSAGNCFGHISARAWPQQDAARAICALGSARVDRLALTCDDRFEYTRPLSRGLTTRGTAEHASINNILVYAAREGSKRVVAGCCAEGQWDEDTLTRALEAATLSKRCGPSARITSEASMVMIELLSAQGARMTETLAAFAVLRHHFRFVMKLGETTNLLGVDHFMHAMELGYYVLAEACWHGYMKRKHLQANVPWGNLPALPELKQLKKFTFIGRLTSGGAHVDARTAIASFEGPQRDLHQFEPYDEPAEAIIL